MLGAQKILRKNSGEILLSFLRGSSENSQNLLHAPLQGDGSNRANKYRRHVLHGRGLNTRTTFPRLSSLEELYTVQGVRKARSWRRSLARASAADVRGKLRRAGSFFEFIGHNR